MKDTIRVLLRDIQTGEEGWYSYEQEKRYRDSQEFWWLEGNGSCDCNRGADLARALGKPDPNLACSASINRIQLLKAEINGVEQEWKDPVHA